MNAHNWKDSLEMRLEYACVETTAEGTESVAENLPGLGDQLEFVD